MTDIMRQEFEAWSLSYAERSNYQHMKNVTAKFPDGSYTTTWVDSAWIGWQASRAELCVELPDVDGDKDFYMDQFSHEGWCAYGQAIDSVKVILDEAGVRYK